MTEPSPMPKNRKFLVALLVLLVIFMYPLVKGLLSAF